MRRFLFATVLLASLTLPGVASASPTLGDIQPGFNLGYGTTSAHQMNWRPHIESVVAVADPTPIAIDWELSGVMTVDVPELALNDFVFKFGHTGIMGSMNYAARPDPLSVDQVTGALTGIVENPFWGDTDFSTLWIDDEGYFHGTLMVFGTYPFRVNCEDDQSCHLRPFRVKTDWVKPHLRDDFEGTVELSNPEIDGSNVKYMLHFTPNAPLPNNGTILLSFPPSYATPFLSLTSSDVAISAPNLIDADVTVDQAGRRIYIDVESYFEIRDEITIVIGDGAAGGFNDLSNPSTNGIYGIGIGLFDSSDDEYGSGIAYAQISNSDIEVSASIIESISVSISSSAIALSINPSLNEGRDRSQYTEFTVSSNSFLDYFIYGYLDDGLGVNQLRSPSGAVIPAGTGENTFGFEATNAAYDMGRVVEGDASLTTVSSLLNSNGENVGHTGGGAFEEKHTIYYDLNVDYLTEPGDYTGTLVYTITPGF